MTKDKLRRNNMKIICGLKQCLPVKCQVKGVTYLVDSVFYSRKDGNITTSERFQKALIGNAAYLTSLSQKDTIINANDFSDCEE